MMAREQTTVRRGYNVEAGGGRLCPCDGSVFTEMGVASAYMATDRAGATPRRLRVMLYDGAIRLCRQGLLALDEGDVVLAGDRLARAGRIVEKLRRDLLAEGHTERLGRFARLYEYVARRLVEADFYRRRELLNETIVLLNCRRGDWDALTRSLDGDEISEAGTAASASWVG